MSLRRRESDDGHWPSISDLMSGLMIIFLLLAVAYMKDVSDKQEQEDSAYLERQRQMEEQKRANLEKQEKLEQLESILQKIRETYQEKQKKLYDRLYDEFRDDLAAWQASIDKDTLAIRFFEPEILFEPGKSSVSPRFKAILRDFFPRYLKIIHSDEFRDSVEEIRIEGHTSSEWMGGVQTEAESYFRNMQLSQARSLSVLEYCYGIIPTEEHKTFVKERATANGLSSSRVILDAQGREDSARSRRVEFRTRTDSERELSQVIDEVEWYLEVLRE